MLHSRLNYKLENIEHSYFCFEKNCPVCGGFNYTLTESYPEKIKLPQNIADILNFRKNIEIGQIWSLKIDAPYPIYVMPIEDNGFFYRCIRVSEFAEFKGEFDIVWNGWLFECWNSFPVLNVRFENMIEKVDNNIFLDVEKKYKSAEIETEKIENVLIAHFREIELNYQNSSFLEQDEHILIKAYEYESEKVISLEESIKKIANKIKSTITDIISPSIEPIFEPVPLAASDKDVFRFGIENSKPLLEDNKIVVLYNFIQKNSNKYIRFYFEIFFDFIPDIEILLNGKNIDFELLYKDKENIYIDIPYEKGEYELKLIFLDKLAILPVKFKV